MDPFSFNLILPKLLTVKKILWAYSRLARFNYLQRQTKFFGSFSTLINQCPCQSQPITINRWVMSQLKYLARLNKDSKMWRELVHMFCNALARLWKPGYATNLGWIVVSSLEMIVDKKLYILQNLVSIATIKILNFHLTSSPNRQTNPPKRKLICKLSFSQWILKIAVNQHESFPSHISIKNEQSAVRFQSILLV